MAEGQILGMDSKTQILPQRALVVGDPDRVVQAVSHLMEAEKVWEVREYLAWRGVYKGEHVLIASHGVGASGASLVFEKLIQGGARVVMRAGTCGSLRPETPSGTLLIPSGAIRDDGASEQVLPLAVPAAADPVLVQALEKSAAEYGYEQVQTGLVWSAGVFYESPYVPSMFESWMAAGALGVEMEMAMLYIMARRYGIRAAGVLAVEGGVEEELDPWNRPPDSPLQNNMMEAMLHITLNTLVKA